MEKENSKTPYNSIYETLEVKNKKADNEAVPCKHGCQCTNIQKPTESQYMNLLPSKEQQLAEKVAAKLKKLKLNKDGIETPKSQRKKKRALKEKKSKTPVVEDNQTYEMIGPGTEGTTDSSALSTTESLELNVKPDSTALAAYLGVQTPSDAESQVSRRGDFALYHQFISGGCLDRLTPGLPLMLVYYTTTKKHRHYPVRCYGSEEKLHYSVDCGYPIVRKHFSLNQLVHYYKTFGSIQIKPDDMCAEEFSWWLE